MVAVLAILNPLCLAGLSCAHWLCYVVILDIVRFTNQDILTRTAVLPVYRNENRRGIIDEDSSHRASLSNIGA